MSVPPQILRVLLVDDHPLVRAALRAELQVAFGDVQVVEAGCASEALAALAARRPDLLLLDVNLPGESGLDLARRIRASHRRIRILMVAAEVDPWTVNEALEAGACGFVAKTNPGGVLRDAVRAVLAGQVFLCPDAQVARQRVEPGRGATGDPPGPAVLSTREREVLRYLAHGENTKSIAALLQISPKTVETHRQHIMRKLGTNNVAALTRYAIRHSLTRP